MRHRVVWRRIVYWITSRVRAVGAALRRPAPTRVWLVIHGSASPSAASLRPVEAHFPAHLRDNHAHAEVWPRSQLGAALCAPVTSWDSAVVYLAYPASDSALERLTSPLTGEIPSYPSGSLPSVGVWSRSRRSGGGHSRSKGLYGALTSPTPSHVWLQVPAIDSALERQAAASGRTFSYWERQEIRDSRRTGARRDCAPGHSPEWRGAQKTWQ